MHAKLIILAESYNSHPSFCAKKMWILAHFCTLPLVGFEKKHIFADMRVITLDKRAFEDTCRRLQQHVADSGFEPDLVLGIATGGVHVSRHIFQNIPHSEILCQRPQTSRKLHHTIIMKTIHRMPRFVKDGLRMAESMWLRNAKVPIKKAILSASAEDAIRNARRILIVDDAVDTGATLRTVLNAVHDVNAGSIIRTCAITVTMPKPVLSADFVLYNNSTLIRFPWSMDAKQ